MQLHEQQRTAPATPVQLDRHLRWPEVQPLVAVSRATWWRMVKRGTAPKQVRVSDNCVAWRASDIAAFLADRAKVAA